MRSDPALKLPSDRLEADKIYSEYIDTWDASKLPIIDGSQPSVFLIKQPLLHQRSRIQQIPAERYMEKATMYLRCGLIGVENYSVVYGDGSTKPVENPKIESFGDWGKIVTEEWLESSHFTSEDIMSIGTAVMNISEARPPLS